MKRSLDLHSDLRESIVRSARDLYEFKVMVALREMNLVRSVFSSPELVPREQVRVRFVLCFRGLLSGLLSAATFEQKFLEAAAELSRDESEDLAAKATEMVIGMYEELNCELPVRSSVLEFFDFYDMTSIRKLVSAFRGRP